MGYLIVFVWFLALLGAFAGELTLLTVVFQTGAPQQAAVAAIAVAHAVIPYCFARAIEKMRGRDREQGESALEAITCPSCGKSIRLRLGETQCYLCKNPL